MNVLTFQRFVSHFLAMETLHLLREHFQPYLVGVWTVLLERRLCLRMIHIWLFMEIRWKTR